MIRPTWDESLRFLPLRGIAGGHNLETRATGTRGGMRDEDQWQRMIDGLRSGDEQVLSEFCAR